MINKSVWECYKKESQFYFKYSALALRGVRVRHSYFAYLGSKSFILIRRLIFGQN